jgi:signal transduction histidine kinase
MDALEILMLVGFATGAVLHLYIARLIARREELWGPEPTFVLLGLVLGLWHVGNLCSAVPDILEFKGINWFTRFADTLTYGSLAFLPAALAHTHIAFWGWRDDYRRVTRRVVRAVAALGYVPLVLLPFALSRFWTSSYTDPIEQLGPGWLTAFSVWHVAVLFECAALDLYLKRYFVDPRERSFFDRLSVALAATAVAYLLVFTSAVYPGGLRSLTAGFEPGLGKWLEVLVQLASLVPTTIVAYYIFRYNLYKLVIERSLVYAVFVGAVMVVYLYGVRAFDQYLVAAKNFKPGVIEAIGVALIVLLYEPVRRALDAGVRRLFAIEIGHYRDLVEQVATESHSFNELRALLPYIESIVARALDVDAVRIVLADGERAEDTEEERALAALRQEMARDRVDMLEDDPRVWALGARAAWGLWRDEELVGLMLIVSDAASLRGEKQAVLAVLAGQVAVAIENTKLVEEKVRLERELMQRERLAALGQMAATVAHEVKNPLSAIKSIVQVMREEEADEARDRDLQLIVGEIDRLNRTVTQLLGFSRPAVADARSSTLGELAGAVARLVEPDARTAGVGVESEVVGDRGLPGSAAGALREVLINLALNAIQATPEGGEVSIRLEGTARGARLEVSDTGCGIPEDLRVKVLQPFFTTKQRGSGLGLAIVERRLAELGGHLEISGRADGAKGTRVSAEVELPAAGARGREPAGEWAPASGPAAPGRRG